MTSADRYAAWLQRPDSGVREDCPSPTLLSPPTELEIQARWFAGELGRSFVTPSGDAVEVVQFGEWNRESGPDFRAASVSINGARPRRGCIELDPDVRDWERHGHAINPAYENVVLHVFWSVGKSQLYTQTLSGRAVPQVKLDLAKLVRRPLNPVPLAKSGPCSCALATMPPRRLADLLTAAAHHRMQRKARRISQTAEIHGEIGAAFPFLAETLGYKSNKLPFLLLAQRLPVAQLRKKQTGLEAALFGVAGFLTAADLSELPGDTRAYLRRIWEDWWPQRAELGNLILAPAMWKCGGVRPLNHPQRRVGALAEIARQWPKTREVLRSKNPLEIQCFFTSLRHEYWDHHYTFTSQPTPKRMALIGPDRISAILMNLVLPLALRENPAHFEKLSALLAPDFNLRVKTASLRLFGADAKRIPLLKNAVHQQGLLQIYDDFCCQDLSDCRDCRFPEQLAQWK